MSSLCPFSGHCSPDSVIVPGMELCHLNPGSPPGQEWLGWKRERSALFSPDEGTRGGISKIFFDH